MKYALKMEFKRSRRNENTLFFIILLKNEMNSK